ncbi:MULTISPECIES: DUF983 domain-containing protein [Sphingobacterium]|uniref:DUF983 domain-containing protein n=2 Tax=Sphingobacteriaceae TaxID=84566 RepID=UPI00211E0460|nr:MULTISPECIES: DUF983 domain-containing protein [Sphingobacterium]MCT1531678.1 DUF983 domain-containing protein [Sphingobacterium daejeonense]
MEVKLKMDTKYTIPSELKSAIEGKCPRCRTGNMFAAPLLSFKSQKMLERCPACDLKFEKEPGYFYVAMYVSYAMSVAELVAACVATYVLSGNLESPWLYVIVALTVTILLAPFNNRYSRIILLYFMTPSFKFNERIFERVKAEGK